MSFDTLGLKIDPECWMRAGVFKSDADAKKYLLNAVTQWFRKEIEDRISFKENLDDFEDSLKVEE